MPAGNRGRPITGAPAEKRAMLATVSLSSTGLRSLSDTTTAATLEPALPHDVERGEAVADGAEIAADGEQQRDLERRHPVEHRAGAFERHHDAADAFDEQHAVGGLDGGAAERDQRVEIEDAVLALGGEIGRQRRAETPGRDGGDFVGGHRPAERAQQHRRVAGLHHRGIVAAHHRLERGDRLVGRAQSADQAGGDEGLADVGAGRGDEIGRSWLNAPICARARRRRGVRSPRPDAAR